MSSLIRRLQIRQLKKQGAKKLPIISVITGTIVAWKWPQTKRQLAFYADEHNSVVPITAETKHPELQPLIDILVDNASRNALAPA